MLTYAISVVVLEHYFNVIEQLKTKTKIHIHVNVNNHHLSEYEMKNLWHILKSVQS